LKIRTPDSFLFGIFDPSNSIAVTVRYPRNGINLLPERLGTPGGKL